MRKSTFGFAASAALLIAGTGQAALISHYTFDANTLTGPGGLGDVYANSVGGAPGAVVSENTGGATSGPTNVAGKHNEAVRFDGIANYLDAGSAGLPNSASGMGAGSVSFWIRSDTADGGADKTVMGSFNGDPNNAGGTNRTGFVVDFENGPDDDFRVFLRGNGDDTTTVDSGAVLTNWNDGTWHHVAVTWDQEDTGNHAIYFDGVLNTLNTLNGAPGETYNAWEHTMTIGAANIRGVVSSFMDGDLDDLRVYDHVLSAREVQALVPEPTSLLLGLCGLGVTAVRRRR